MTVHQHTGEENSLKPTKNVLPRKLVVVAEVCGETYSKTDQKMEYKNGYKRNKKHSKNADNSTSEPDTNTHRQTAVKI